MTENLDPLVDNQAPARFKGRSLMQVLRSNKGEVNAAPPPPPSDPPPADAPPLPPPDAGGGWKSGLSTDLQGSPLLGKFEDTSDGLNAAFASHNNLETLLGHEKVPIPTGPEDSEGWNRFNKAMGVPDASEGYGLADAQLPESMQGITIDKAKFSEVVHAHKLTPAQAKGMWETYQQINVETYQNAKAGLEKQVTDAVNSLRGEWGDAYDSNVELGQAVINKFGSDQDAIDYITSTLSKDTRGIKFLASIGGQFAENKIGDFSMKRFSLAPEEAQGEVDKMTNDLNGAYHNTQGKFTEKEHVAAMDRVNYLRASIIKSKG